MFEYRPFPMLDAALFLLNGVNGYSAQKFYDTIVLRFPNNADEFNGYFKLLLKLEDRLRAGTTADDGELHLLFDPLSLKDKQSGAVNQDSISSLIAGSECGFAVEDEGIFFDKMRDEPDTIRLHIANAVSVSNGADGAPPFTEAPDMAGIFSIINESNWPQSSKYTLFDVAMNPQKYIDLLERTLRPVAAAFVESEDIWSPLIEPYRETCESFKDAAAMADQRFNFHGNARSYIIYPTVTGFRQGFSSNPSAENPDFIGVLGVLFDLLFRISSMESNASAEVSRIMSVLGDPSRFNILHRLTKGPTYGRELAKHLNISPGTVSQHISILAGAGLVKSSAEGNKTYYSIDNARMQEFIRSLKALFPEG